MPAINLKLIIYLIIQTLLPIYLLDKTIQIFNTTQNPLLLTLDNPFFILIIGMIYYLLTQLILFNLILKKLYNARYLSAYEQNP